MAHEGSSGIYDRYFSSWLDKRVKFFPRRGSNLRNKAPKRYSAVNVTALQLAEIDPQVLARLNALGLAT